MLLHEILQKKGSNVVRIAPDASLETVVAVLVHHNIGSLLVCDHRDHALGIVTERDLLRAMAARAFRLGDLRVTDVMSRELVTAQPDDSLEDAMRLMTNRRVRHLPVLSEGQLRGIVSIGDLVKAHHDQLEMENHFLRSYVSGEGGERGTPPPPANEP